MTVHEEVAWFDEHKESLRTVFGEETFIVVKDGEIRFAGDSFEELYRLAQSVGLSEFMLRRVHAPDVISVPTVFGPVHEPSAAQDAEERWITTATVVDGRHLSPVNRGPGGRYGTGTAKRRTAKKNRRKR